MNCEGMAEPTGFMADLCVFSHFIRRVIGIILADSCGFVQSVRDVAANIRGMGGFVQCLAIAAYSLNAMKGRVGAGRTRARYATRFLQPTLLRASPETPFCFALRLSQSLASSAQVGGLAAHPAQRELHLPERRQDD